MTFGEYIWALLPPPFKKAGSDVQLLFNAIGTKFDELKQAFFQVRRAWVIDTAPSWALDLHGQDRKMPRAPGESDDVYRGRLQAARITYAKGGTDTGIIEALARMGLEANINNYYEDDPDRWAEFSVTITSVANPLTEDKFNAALLVVQKTKASHAKLVELAVNFTWNDFDQKEFTWNDLDALGLTWNNFDLGGWYNA